MKNKQVRRILAALLAAIMVCTLFVGCNKQPAGQEQPKATENNAADKADNQAPADVDSDAWKEVAAKVDIPTMLKEDMEHMSWMDDTSPVTLDVYYARTIGAVDEFPTWGGTAVQQKITEVTGVTIDGTFPMVPEDALNELTLLIASGDPLPGIICNLPKDSTQYQDLVEAGELWDLKELAEMYAPTALESMDAYAINSNLSEDGALYGFPRQYQTSRVSPYMASNGWILVRGDICEDMGIEPESIKTLADMEKYLQFVVDNQADYPEIKYPILTPSIKDGSDSRPFYNAVGGLANFDGGLQLMYDKASDSVHYWIEDELGKESLKVMFDWAQKGFITESAFAADFASAEARSGSPACVFGENVWYYGDANSTFEANGMDAYYVRIPMVSAEGVDAVQSSTSYASGSLVTAITKDCADPARAIRFLEFLDTEYANMLIMLGVYGEDWVEAVSEDGIPYAKYLNKEVGEGDLPRGIYDYESNMMVICADYDYFNDYCNMSSTGDDLMVRCAQDFVYDTYAAAPAFLLSKVGTDSAEYQYYLTLSNIMQKYVPEIVLAKDEAEFETLYQACLDEMEANHLADWKEVVLKLTQDYIVESESYGVVFN